MKKMLLLSILLLFSLTCYASDYNQFNGKTIGTIEIKTSRVSAHKVKKKFGLTEGDLFNAQNYETAKESLHDMRVFKSIDFNINEVDDNTINISIDAKDSYYIFPMIFGTGGKKSTFGAALMEGNLFKLGESIFTFGAFNSDGYMVTGGFGIDDNFFSVSYRNMKYKEYVYKNKSYSNSGLFSGSSKENKHGEPLYDYDVDSNAIAFMWVKSFHKKVSINLGISLSDVVYTGTTIPLDKGKHNKFLFGIKKFNNVKSGSGGFAGSFGAIFGIGLSDVKDQLADLPKEKYGYLLALNYENGGEYLGSDYPTSKINLKAIGNIEFKKRHVLILDIAGAKDFESPFYDRIKSKDVLSGKGRYSREFRGDYAVGTGASFIWYLIKNTTGVLTLMPFIENAIVWNNANPQNQGGAGASLSYRLWRIPFPIGINFTQNLNDGSSDFYFLFGGGF